MTYGDFARRIARLHTLFANAGIRRGDKIALMGRNTSSWVTIFFGTITYGAVIVPVLQDFNPQDAQHIINHSDAVMLFVSNSIWETLEYDKMPRLKGVLSLDDRQVLAESDGPDGKISKILRNLSRKFRAAYKSGFGKEQVSYPQCSKDSLAVINYTSGTTGFSKGVMLTHNNLCGNVMFGIHSRLHYQGSRCLSFLPLAHAYGCAFDMLVPLAVGTHVTLLGKLPSPKLLLKAMSEIRPNLVICVPLILEKIYRKQILPMISKRSMRWALAIPLLDTSLYATIRRRLVKAFGGEFEEVIVGGAPLNREVEEFLHKIKFPFTVGYGMTECAPPDQLYTLASVCSRIVGAHTPDHGIEDPQRRRGRHTGRDMRTRRECYGRILQESRRDRSCAGSRRLAAHRRHGNPQRRRHNIHQRPIQDHDSVGQRTEHIS